MVRSPSVNNFPQPPGGSDFSVSFVTDSFNELFPGLNPAAVRASAPQLSIDQTPSAPPVKKEPPVYPPGIYSRAGLSHVDDALVSLPLSDCGPVFVWTGSEEERWQLQIVAKGRVTCPKCKSVSRKTVDGLKKHMDNCRLVRAVVLLSALQILHQ